MIVPTSLRVPLVLLFTFAACGGGSDPGNADGGAGRGGTGRGGATAGAGGSSAGSAAGGAGGGAAGGHAGVASGGAATGGAGGAAGGSAGTAPSGGSAGTAASGGSAGASAAGGGLAGASGGASGAGAVAGAAGAAGGTCGSLGGAGAGCGGSGGASCADLAGLSALLVTPSPSSVSLSFNGATFSGSTQLSVEATVGGQSRNVTSLVKWTTRPLPALSIDDHGHATFSVPGIAHVTASLCGHEAQVDLSASYQALSMAPGFTGQPSDFEGTPAAAAVLAYPLSGTQFPSNLGPVTFHVSRTTQTQAKVMLTAEGVSVAHLAPCAPGPASGCFVELPASLTSLLVKLSETQDLKAKVRLSGGSLSESHEVSLAWTNIPLTGALYYWTSITSDTIAAYPGYTFPDGFSSGTALLRYDLGQATLRAPDVVWTDKGPSKTTAQYFTDIKVPAAATAYAGSPSALASGDPRHVKTNDAGQTWGEGTCNGCHVVSHDGRIMAMSIGGSAPGDLAMLDLATMNLAQLDAAANGGDTAGWQNLIKRYRKADFATMMALNADGSRLVTMYRGAFYLRGYSLPLQGPAFPSGPLTFATNAPLTFSAVGTESVTDPFWSADGQWFAFTSYNPGDVPFVQGSSTLRNPNGDLKTNGRIWLAEATQDHVSDVARVLVDRQAGVTTYGPAVSADGEWVAFNQSSCAGPTNPGAYGTAACDGYDDTSASLWMVKAMAGGAAQALTRANGEVPNVGNSWPRFSPTPGTFRGKKTYFVAFSSRRSYGLAPSSSPSPRQLWMAAVSPGEALGGDPSAAAFWLPLQNVTASAPTGNHTPQWVSKYFPSPQ